MFGRATITLGIGPHSSCLSCDRPRYLNCETYERLQSDNFKGGDETTLRLSKGLNTIHTVFFGLTNVLIPIEVSCNMSNDLMHIPPRRS